MVEKALPNQDDPFAARAYIFTVVTPDIDASIHFYRDIVGYDLIDQGRLEGRLPTVAGVGEAGRPYALLRHNQKIAWERGIIRLLLAPKGATENRPRPGARIMDPGWATIEGHPQDWQAAYHRMVNSGVRVTSPPIYYYGPQEPPVPTGYSITFSAYGPSGEEMFISSHPTITPNYTGMFGPLYRHTLMCLDRWPVLEFYNKVFGLKISTYGTGTDAGIYVGYETLNFKTVDLLIDAPPDTYFWSLNYDYLPCEVWEYRQWDPEKATMWPTSLDRTGLALITIIVDDLAVIRNRVNDNGIPILGEGALPTPEAKTRDGFYIRGAVGELIEVVGRA